MKEEWFKTNNNSDDGRTIIEISNLGRIKRKNGKIEYSKLRQIVTWNGKKKLIYRLIASMFLITVHRPDQTCIDHITHNPTGMNVNDVRNLRWCTVLENNNFPEFRENNSSGHKGKPSWNKGLKYKVVNGKAIVYEKQ